MKETFARYRSHSHQSRGIQSVKMSLDGQHILVNGMNDGTLVCLRWRYVQHIASNSSGMVFKNRSSAITWGLQRKLENTISRNKKRHREMETNPCS